MISKLDLNNSKRSRDHKSVFLFKNGSTKDCTLEIFIACLILFIHFYKNNFCYRFVYSSIIGKKFNIFYVSKHLCRSSNLKMNIITCKIHFTLSAFVPLIDMKVYGNKKNLDYCTIKTFSIFNL